MQQRFDSGGEYLPGKGRAGVFHIGVEQAGVLGDDDLGLGVGVVVRPAVSHVHEAGFGVDISRLDNLRGAAGEQAENIGRRAGADVALGRRGYAVPAGAGQEAGPQPELAVHYVVKVVHDHIIRAHRGGAAVDGEGGSHGRGELVLIDVVHHAVAALELGYGGGDVPVAHIVHFAANGGVGEHLHLRADVAEEGEANPHRWTT